MQKYKSKILFLLIGILFLFFFNNSFGIVDIEKMAIITAVGIDMEDDKYSVTAQIAVPEEDSSHTEKKKTHIVGKGITVGDAIREISDNSGWYPQLVFCNLIVLGKDLGDKNVLTSLDYFAKTLRIQDSALVVYSTEKASDLLAETSPLDNISSFALQKILYKKSGFNKDVAEINIKDFCSMYYSRSSSSFMPIINKISLDTSGGSEQDKSGDNKQQMGGMNASGNSSNSSSDSGGSTLFSAKTTALFKNGVMVGELNEHQTIVYNVLRNNFSDSTLSIEGVDENLAEKTNYLLNVLKSTSDLSFDVNNEDITLNVNIDIYCKVGDQNSKSSHQSLSKNEPLPDAVKKGLEEKLYNDVFSFFQILKQTDCDMLKLDEKLYRFHHEYYPAHKDNLLEKMKLNISVSVTGQK